MDLIGKYFTNLSSGQIKQLSALKELYTAWNSQINVISRKDIENFYRNHLLHSLSIAKFISFKPGSSVLDAGCGGGLPGLPLAVMFPQAEFILLDSTAKKLKVAQAIAKEIGLTNVTTEHSRLEDYNGSFDFVVSRAVSRLDVMWAWVAPLIKPGSNNGIKNGLIYLKGGDINSELPNNAVTQKIDLNELFGDTVFDEKALVYICKAK